MKRTSFLGVSSKRLTAQAERSYPMPKIGAVAERSNPTSKEQQLHRCRKAERSYSMLRIRRDDLVQGKEQWLHFAGASVKRYPKDHAFPLLTMQNTRNEDSEIETDD